jgi:hypothetical protein
MKLRLSIPIAVVSFITAFGVAPATQAQSHASASFGDYRYELVDLNPGDGIDPGISFYNGAVTAQAHVYDTPYATGTPRYSMSDDARTIAGFSVDSNGVYLVAYHTQTSGDADLEIAHGSGNLSAWSTSGFLLAPYTQVTFTVYGRVNEVNSPGNISSGTVTISGRLHEPDGGLLEDRASLVSDMGTTGDDLSITLRTGADQLYGEYEFRNDVTAQVLSPVPEPASAAMLAAGLCLIGVRARRRTARKAGFTA